MRVAMKVVMAVIVCLGLLTQAEAQNMPLCGPIEVLNGEQGRKAIASREREHFVLSPGPTQRRYVDEARALMTPLVCAGARRVAFIDRATAPEGWVPPDRPDIVHMPLHLSAEPLIEPTSRHPQAAQMRADLLHALVHEGTHAASNLLKLYDGSASRSSIMSKAIRWFSDAVWTDAGRTEARRMVEQNRLGGGLYEQWAAMHQTFVNAGLAAPYHGKGASTLERDVLVSMGFTTGYAGDKPGEDIAELTAAIRTRHVYAEKGSPKQPLDLACQVLREQPGPLLPERFAPFFVKVGFLHSLGFITDDDYDYCVGNLRIRGDGSGMFSYEGNILVNEYNGNPRGSIGRASSGDAWMFQFEAEGTVTNRKKETVPVTARLQIMLAPGDTPFEEVSFPRGIYRIIYGAGGHSFQVFTTGRDGGQIVVNVEEGVVLISRASLSLIEGAIVVQRASDRTSLLPLPTIRHDRVVTFRKENRFR